ncbi:S10 family peptidase [Acidipila sp. EB88]|uniref:S10 family peptidase n=1 Tax=Acidipila sp. EB88 TaxID=2305226 RepID=UPI000F5E21E7|nr:peptidase S10 [Acidipila sp. EB88]RRA48377.1 peptidase S10 [Acidipila sp. EB88]
MSLSRLLPVRCAAALALSFLLTPVVLPPALAQEHPDAPAKSAPAPDAKDAKTDALPPLPADASVAQTVTVGGRTLHYTATVGIIPVYSRLDPAKPETKTGEVVVTSYLLDGAGDRMDRPVTFAMNGGPGASSVYLNLGAIGPKHIQFAEQGDSPSDPARLTDNPGTWLPFSDMVFIDPIGTGFSRSLVSAADTRKLFYSTTPDIEYLSRVIYDWLVKNGRLQSRKYLIGESYGGYRGPRVTHYLQAQLGVAMNGVVLVSPYLNPWIEGNGEISPLPWMMSLPSIAAAHLEREHQLTPEHMADVIAYTRGEYATDLMAGRSNPEATPRIIRKVTDMTGLDPAFVKHSGGRIEIGAYLREVHREKGEIGSVYDSNVTSPDPFPFSPDQDSNDPILESIIAPTTTAMVDWVTRVVGWKTTARYNALSYDVGENWDRDRVLERGSTHDLREAVAADPKLRVLIAHGWDDLSCPFMGSVLTVDELPAAMVEAGGDPTRVAVHEYPGGHMFYTRHDSQAAFGKDVEAMFAAH